jgi:ribosomal protein S18 acetylase RimI-like enzyme
MPESTSFARTLERTYEGTLDFPELSNIRTVDEILTSYRANLLYRPEHWRLAILRGELAGVLMLTELEPLGGWDLTYIGIVPEQRQKGLGRMILDAALHIVAHAAGTHLDVAVDARNLPALQLYAGQGFQLQSERRVCLSFLNPE